jgi:hypothetical protein
MRSTPRFRFKLRQLMLFVVFCAVILGALAWIKAKQDAVRARAYLSNEVAAAVERTAWAERMFSKGYVSKAQLDLEREKLKMSRNRLASY